MKRPYITMLTIALALLFVTLSSFADEKSMHQNAAKRGAFEAHDSSRTSRIYGDRFGYYMHEGFEAAMRNDVDKAIEMYTVASNIGRRNKYIALSNRARLYYSMGEYDLAMADYSKIIEIKPKYISAYISRGNLWLAKKDTAKAIEDFTLAIKVNPKAGPAYVSRGRLLASLGRQEDAFKDFDKATKLDKDTPNSRIAMAWFLATCPEDNFRDGSKAIELAQQAIEITHRWQGMVRKKTSVEVITYQHLELAPQYDVLAAAYAETGNFTEAVATEQKAISLLAYENTSKYLPYFSQRLKSYEEMKPWRDIENYQ